MFYLIKEDACCLSRNLNDNAVVTNVSLDARRNGSYWERLGKVLEGMHEKERRNRKWAKLGVSKVLATIIQGGHAHARWVPCSPRTLHACTTRGFRWIPVHDICSWRACVRNGGDLSTCSPFQPDSSPRSLSTTFFCKFPTDSDPEEIRFP